MLTDEGCEVFFGLDGGDLLGHSHHPSPQILSSHQQQKLARPKH
jgi:hypothetical protein